MMMKRFWYLVAFLSLVIGHAQAWVVADQGGGVWTGSEVLLQQDAVLTIPSDASADITLAWGTVDNSVATTYIVNTGSWTFADANSGRIHTFNASTNTWEDKPSLTAASTQTWTYNQTDKEWSQTVGGSVTWKYDEAAGWWDYNAGGSDIEWRYAVDTNQWTHVTSSSVWSYNPHTRGWTLVSGTDPDGLVMPAEPLLEQMQYQTVMYRFLKKDALGPGVIAGLTASGNGDNTWNGKDATSTQLIAYDSSASGYSVTWKNDGAHSHQKGTLLLEYNPTTTGWKLTHTFDPLWTEWWAYDGTGGTWHTFDSSANEWDYNTTTRRWQMNPFPAGEPEEYWRHDDTADIWVHHRDGVEKTWKYDGATDYWEYDPSGSPSKWKFSFASNTWTEVTSTGQTPTMPILVVVQRNLVDSVADALNAVGAFSVSGPFGWQSIAQDGAVYKALNASGRETVTYTPSSMELAWAAPTVSPEETFTYNISTGAWTWTNQYGSADQTFTYDPSTGEWDDGGTHEYTYANTAGTRTWTSADASIVWTYQPASDTWKNSKTESEWKYAVERDTWTRQSDHLEMRYSFAERGWFIVEGGIALPGLDEQIPRGLMQQELIARALQHFQTNKHFSTTGPFGWTLVAQGDGSYIGDTVAGDERLTFDPNRIPYMIHNRNKGALAIQQDTLVQEYDINGDWRVTRSINIAIPEETTFMHSTGLWKAADGSTPWHLKTDAGTYWYETATERKWSRDTTNNRWTDSVSSAAWSYDGATGVWTNHTGSTTWRHDAMADVWTQVSGTATTAVNMPPQPLREYALMRAMYATVEATGVFVAVKPLSITLTKQGDGTWKWQRAGSNDSLVFDETASGVNRLVWATVDDSREWKCDPENGDWTWSATDSGSTVHSWSYSSSTGLWSDTAETASWKLGADLTWTNQNDTTESWQYDPIVQQWKNLKTNEVWGYYSFVHALPINDVYTWINVTNKTSWVYDDRIQTWSQAAGVVVASPMLPPKPVRQMTLIHIAWRAALASGALGTGSSYGWTSISRQSNGTWTGDNADDDQSVTLDSRHETYHIQTTQTDFEAWVEKGAQWWSTPTGPWQWRNRLDPFVSQTWAYDTTTKKWSRSDYTDLASWTYNPTALTWTHDTAGHVWKYHVATARWENTDSSSNQYWTYASENGKWTNIGTSSDWRFNHIAQTWSEVTDPLTNAVLSMPPLPVIQHEVVYNINKALRDADAFEEHAQPTWHADEYNWYTTSSSGNAQAQYDVRQTYQLSWQDTHTQNRMQYNTATGDWLWRADDQRWQYRAAVGLWGRDTSGTPADNWVYSSGASISWTKGDDATNTWKRGENAYTWRYQATGPIWTYEPATNDWIFGAQRWMYNFATGAWIEVSDTHSVPDPFPPLPLVQQMFITALNDSVTTFFANPLYAAAQQVPDSNHPLFGSRPLKKNSKYDRYNASSVLVNADVTLDHVTWVHNDISRNHGRLQLPAVGTTALPAILGGDRAGLFDTQWAPRIILYDSAIACHEPLVSAGVRWNVIDRPIIAGQSPVDAHNTSMIIAYNKGRVLDMPQRRGVVFQLGSQANRMADGTVATSMNTLSNGVLSTSTLRDAYIDIYRAQATLGANADEPTKIDLLLKSVQETGVSALEQSTQVLYLSNRSRLSLGWPTSDGASGERPWSVLPATITALKDAGSSTLFSASNSGGGRLGIAGANWYIGGRDESNKPAKYPVKTIDQDAVVYLEHGGLIETTGVYDFYIDTIIARRIAQTEQAGGRLLLASDQVMYGPDGKVQPHSLDFTGAAQSSGTYAGHVRVTGKHDQWAVGSTLHGTGTNKVK